MCRYRKNLGHSAYERPGDCDRAIKQQGEP